MHPPQCDVFVWVSTHTLPHFVRPPVHTQTPAEQTCPLGQTLPQEPQLLGSVASVVQPLAQRVWPAEQEGPQTPLVQTPLEQITPQRPQLLGSKVTTVQTPLQQVVPLGQHARAPGTPQSWLTLAPHRLQADSHCLRWYTGKSLQ